MGLSPSGRRRSKLDVTPLVDVVLVLLIIFMVAMPLSLIKTPLAVPSDEAIGGGDIDRVTIAGAADGSLTIVGPTGQTTVTRIELAKVVHQTLSTERPTLVYLDFDDSVRYADAVSVMDTVRGAAKHTPGVRIAMTIRSR